MSKRRRSRTIVSRESSGTSQPYQKISEKIKDVAQPWVRELGSEPPLDAIRAVHVFVANLWNARRARSKGEAGDPLEQFGGLLRDVLPELPRQEVARLMEKILTRVSRHDDDPRIVLDVQLHRLREGQFKIDAVGATFPEGREE